VFTPSTVSKQSSSKGGFPMKINWLNYTHHVLSCLLVTLSILTIFSAEYVVFPTSLLLGCLLIPLLFEQHLFSRRMTWGLSVFFAILVFALLFIIKTNHISLSYPATTLLLFVLASLSFSNSFILHKHKEQKAAR
jgi:hypothetical protein